MHNRVLVWDWPVRIGHWLLVMGFVLAWLTSDIEAFDWLHKTAGSVVVGVAFFRVVWGFLGTRYARFSNFVVGWATLKHYLLSLLTFKPAHYIGHNPAGGWAILLLLCLAILTGLSGWATYEEIGGMDAFADIHEALASTMLAVVLVHIGGVVVSSVLHRESLVKAMLHGYKQGDPAFAIPSARLWALVVLLVWVSFFSVWLLN